MVAGSGDPQEPASTSLRLRSNVTDGSGCGWLGMAWALFQTARCSIQQAH
jgi:hypothetical protein